MLSSKKLREKGNLNLNFVFEIIHRILTRNRNLEGHRVLDQIVLFGCCLINSSNVAAGAMYLSGVPPLGA